MSYTLKSIQTQAINGVAPEFKAANDYYVSKGGNDATGTGSILSPYLTIQKAINVCEALPFGTPRVIHVSSGTYTENLTILKPRISILGEGRSMTPDTGSSISGTVNIGLQGAVNTDVNNNNIRFNGLFIIGTVLSTGSNSDYRLFLTDCYLYSTDQCLQVMSMMEVFKVYIDNCSISNTSTTATNYLTSIFGSKGMVSITNSKLTARGNTQIVCQIVCQIDTLANTVFTSDSTSSQALQILDLRGNYINTIGNCAFVYSNSAQKTNLTNNSCGIYLSSSASLIIIQSFFSLLGLPAGQNAIINVSSGKVYYGNNFSTSASGISGDINLNKYELAKLM